MPFDGLSSQEALKRLRIHGRNQLPSKPPLSVVLVFCKQFFSPVLLILLAVGVMSFFVGEYIESASILAAIIFVAVMGFFLELHAVRTLHAFSQVLRSEVYVVRDGAEVLVDVTSLVPGDVVLLEQGQCVPADGVVAEAQDLCASEAMLTGVSTAVMKSAASEPPPLQNAFQEFSFQKDLTQSVYMGTMVVGGFGKMVVVHTGLNTAMGKLANSLPAIKQSDTPLQKKLKKISAFLTVVILLIVSLVMMIGVVKGYEVRALTLIVIALAVSTIPKGLSLILINILSVAMRRIFKKHGLVRSLIAVETLGSVDVICINKTGVLTYGELKLVDVIAKSEMKPLLYRALAVTADMHNPLEHEMKRWMEKKGLSFEAVRTRHPRVWNLPFALDTRFTATQTARHLYAFGAPEILLERTNATDVQKKSILRDLEEFGKKGYRLLGVVGKEKRSTAKPQADDVKGLDWYGFVVFRDQERRDVNRALKNAKAAGVQVKVITGDFPHTAKGLLERVGWYVSNENICTGEQVEKALSTKERRALVARCEIFARVTPKQKLLIIQSLQDAGFVVAMMGDGVNDTLALKTADVSIVMRTSSDVSKQIADLVLLNNSFSTVISAIKEGRMIFAQIRQVIVYLMSGSFTLVILVFVSIVFGLPIPLTALQMLWISILIIVPQSIVLILESIDQQVMKHGPTKKDEQIFPLPIAIFAGLVSILMSSTAFGLYLYYLHMGIEVAQTMVFLLALVFMLVNIFSVRTLLEPIWKISFFSNKGLIWMCIGSVIFQLFCIFHPGTRNYLGIRMVEPFDVVLIGGLAMVVLVAVEGIKSAVRTFQPHQSLAVAEK